MSKLEYNEEKHEYKINGIIVPSPTAIFKELQLADFSKVDKDTLKLATDFGKAVHKACELLDNNILNEDELDKNLIPAINSWKRFKKDYDIEEIIANEIRVFSEKYMFAGTLDRVVKAKIKNKLILIDIKTNSNVNVLLTGMQTAGYNICWKEMGKEKINDRYCIKLGVEEKDFKIIHLNNKMDKDNFLHCLAVYNLKKMKNRG